MIDEPTSEQLLQAERVQKVICGEINLLAGEGICLAALLAGLGTAVADLITSQRGAEHVAPWFDRNAQLVRQLQSRDS